MAYASNLDIGTAPARVRNHSSYISPPHDKYYSSQMRDVLEQRRDGDIDLFFSGWNKVY